MTTDLSERKKWLIPGLIFVFLLIGSFLPCENAFALKFIPPELNNIAPALNKALAYLKKGQYDKAEDLAIKRISEDPKDWSAHLLLSLAYLGKGDEKKAWERAAYLKKLSPQNSATIYRSLGKYYISKKRTYRALHAFQKALEINKEPVSLEAIGTIYRSRGQLENAKPFYLDLQKYGIGQIDLSRIYMALKEYKKAIPVARELVRKSENATQAKIVLATCLLMNGQFDEAIGLFSEMQSADPNFFLAYDMLGLSYLCKMQPGRTIEICTDALKKYPKLKELHIKMAVAHQLNGNLDKAMSAIELALASAPSDALTHLVKASIHFARKERAIGEKSLKKASTLYLDFSRVEAQASKYFLNDTPKALAYFSLSNILYREGIFSKTIEICQSAVAAKSANPFFAVNIARSYAQLECFADARRIYTEAIRAFPRISISYLELGELEYKNEKYNTAIDLYIKASEKFQNQIRIYWGLGEFHYKSGQIDKSIDAYEKVIKLNPGNFAGYNQLSWITSEKKGENKKALMYANKAYELSPNNPQIIDTLGWILFKEGKYNKALKLYKSVAQSVKIPDFYYHLGAIQNKTGQNSDAEQSLEHALNMTDTFANYNSARKLLLSISGF